ncbi:hypothetical protein EYF80_049778 [Liparis tanakae]|uniref:Uncharacterized protein n=1 Tax=Liparis tanakae TaxID=230148 RepID=A0A4Z2FGZ7_9TELE|nr:hypothetical protein EYF80_049778 [Liparis tanakae]
MPTGAAAVRKKRSPFNPPVTFRGFTSSSLDCDPTLALLQRSSQWDSAIMPWWWFAIGQD